MNSPIVFDNASVLTSWKDIARYMGKGVRTVQRWEQDFGLPVRRPLGSSKKAVLARPRELDAWVALRCGSRAEQSFANPAIDSRARDRSLIVLSSLSAKIETSRLLRDNNIMLINEVKAAVEELRCRLDSLHQAAV
jgi:predicted DNA-binding transcriptional regulator AlpA